ncbi:MAG TPA: hypothetical protein VK364_09485, partial [Hymenobacter sp.]|nr:hypothetical protein [Hymenobacter sp.]
MGRIFGCGHCFARQGRQDAPGGPRNLNSADLPGVYSNIQIGRFFCSPVWSARAAFFRVQRVSDALV